MFAHSIFNGDISQWNTAGVESMLAMFQHSFFEGDISQWDVSNVKNFDHMFQSAKFRGDLSRWNVSSAMHMNSLFEAYHYHAHDWDIPKGCRVYHDARKLAQRLPRALEDRLFDVFNTKRDIDEYLARFCDNELTRTHVQRAMGLRQRPAYIEWNDFRWIKEHQEAAQLLGLSETETLDYIMQAMNQQPAITAELLDFSDSEPKAH